MLYNIKGTEVDVSNELRSYVERKLASLDKFVSNKDIVRVDIELEYKESEERQYRAEFMLHDPELSGAVRAEAAGFKLHEAIDITVAEMFQELTRSKKKRLQVLRRTAVKVKEYLRGWRSSI